MLQTAPVIHRFELAGKRYAIDPETCFCFECDAVSWDVLEYYPAASARRIQRLLEERHSGSEIDEVISELEWLRATKAILPLQKLEDAKTQFEAAEGLQRLTLRWNSATPASMVQETALFLLARAGPQKRQHYEVAVAEADFIESSDKLRAALGEVLRLGRLSGKELRVAVRVDSPTLSASLPACTGQQLSLRIECGDDASLALLERLAATRFAKTAKIAKLLNSEAGNANISAAVLLLPRSASFQAGVAALQEAGFKTIVLDLTGAFSEVPGLSPAEMTAELRATAEYYAGQLLERRFFRLEPIAALFSRIYEGKPLRRADPAGAQALAVDEQGDIYPAPEFIGQEIYRVGNVSAGRIDEALLRPFGDTGVLTTAVCLRCWARHLCGGGIASVNAALTGNVRTPSEAWCDAQRAWLESAVAAFNLLSTAGTNFTQLYSGLGQSQRPSLLTLARYAFSSPVNLRPIAEADAALLTQWENWSEAAYFLFHERGVFMATRYDREMDSLHPRDYEQEYVITRANGTAFGLLRIRPDKLPGTAWAWLYFRDPEDKQAAAALKAMRRVLLEAGTAQGIHTVLLPTGPKDTGLAGLLDRSGLLRGGSLRDALYLHGAWYPVGIHRLSLKKAQAVD